MLFQSLWQVHEFAEHLKVSEIMTTENFQEAAALLQEGLVPVELVQATHDAVESALQRIHRLIYPNSQTVVPPHEIQQSSVQVAEDPQESPQVGEGGESEMEVLNGPDPSRALRDPSEEEKAPEYELSQVEVEELMQAEVTGENMEMQIRVMRRILNNQIPTPKCLTQEVAKPKLPKKAIRSRGRLLLIKASMMKGKGLKGKKNKDNKVKDGSKKKDNKVKDGAKKKHKKVERQRPKLPQKQRLLPGQQQWMQMKRRCWPRNFMRQLGVEISNFNIDCQHGKISSCFSLHQFGIAIIMAHTLQSCLSYAMLFRVSRFFSSFRYIPLLGKQRGAMVWKAKTFGLMQLQPGRSDLALYFPKSVFNSKNMNLGYNL